MVFVVGTLGITWLKMKFFIVSFACSTHSLLGIALTLLATSSPVVQASCLDEFHEDCDKGWGGGVHHITRRSVSSAPSNSLKVEFAPEVPNVTYYNTGDEISFSLNLTHNQSTVADITQGLKVVISSQFLQPKSSSLSEASGLISNQTFNSSALSFDISSLGQNDVVNAFFVGIVKNTIHPLASLYFVVHVTGTDGSNADYHYGPVPSLPTLYAVFPRVSLRRVSYEHLWVGDTTSYSMTVTMPKLDFSLLVEISTAINEFSFMEVKEVLVTSVGQNINVGAGGRTKSPQPQYDAGEQVPFNDRSVLDFGNLTVTGTEESKNKIVIHFNVTIRDHPLLANNTKHWVGAGMRSGYQMLWVGQEALYIYKSEPSLSAELTAVNDTKNKRYVIGDELHVSWIVNHTKNTSYEEAQNVVIAFYSNKTLKFLSGTYEESAGGGEKPLTFKDSFHSNAITISKLAIGNSIQGKLVLEVSENVSPLQTLDVFLQLSYQNLRGDDKLNTTHKVSYVAGVPVFSLELNSTSNKIRIGGRAKFFFTILMRKMVSPLKAEVILPVNESSIMSVTAFRVVSVGSKIENHAALSKVQPQLNSTVGDPKLHDRATIDFGTVKSVSEVGTEADHKILMEIEIIVNDHSNVTNGSKQWVGVGVRGGEWMIWICEIALIADVPTDRRPVLQVFGICALPDSQVSCSDATTLKRSSKVYFNGTVYHDQRSQQYADNVKVLWMIPPYVTFSQLHSDPGITYQTTDCGPKFLFNQKLHFLDRLTFSVEGKLDPTGIMPPGDTYAVSPIQLTYSPHSMSAIYGAPLAPVSFKFKSPGEGAPEKVLEDLPEVYSRGFLLDLTGNTVYICQKSNDRSLSSCFSTSDEGASWMAIDQHVCCIIGQDGTDLYGIACNKRAYMRRRDSDRAWYAVDEETWKDAKNKNVDIQKTLCTIPDDYSNSGDHPTDKVVGSAPQWGANMKGVFVNKAGWKLKAQWKCCGY